MRSLKSVNRRTVNIRGITEVVTVGWVDPTKRPPAGRTKLVLFVPVCSGCGTNRPPFAVRQRSVVCNREHEIRVPGLDAPIDDR